MVFGFNSITVQGISDLVAWLSNYLDGLSGFSVDTMNLGWTIVWAIQICNFLLIYFGKNLYKKYLVLKGEKSDNTYKFIELIYGINAYLFLFLPLYVLNINFIRIVRNVVILDSIVYAIIFYILTKTKTLIFRVGDLRYDKFFFTSSIFVYYVLFFYYEYLYGGENLYSMIISSFANNWLI